MKELFLRILYSLIGISFGTVLVLYANKIVDNVGRMELAEKYLGFGGTYTAVRLIGIFLIFFFLAYMTGILGPVYKAITGFFLSIFGAAM